MNKSQSRELQQPEVEEVTPQKRFSAKAKSITFLSFFAIAFIVWGIIAAKAPEPIDLKKIVNIQYKNTSGYSKDDIDYLSGLGFNQSATVLDNSYMLNTQTKEYVAKTYGLNYVSDIFFKKNIIEKYNLTIAPKERFIRSIPKNNLEELKKNLDLLNTKDKNEDFTITQQYFIINGNTAEQKEQKEHRIDLVICAPKSYFDTGGLSWDDQLKEWILPKPKDPIIMAKYKSGYIILTAWEE